MARFLYLGRFLYPAIGGGAKSMLPVLRHLVARGHEVVSVNGGPELGLPPGELRQVGQDGFQAFLAADVEALADRVLDDLRPDVVLTQGWGSREAIRQARAHPSAPRLALFLIDLIQLGPQPGVPEGAIDYEANHATYHHADLVIANSHFTRTRAAELAGLGSQVVYPIVEPEGCVAPPPFPGVRPPERTHLTLAAATRGKGLPHLLAAAPALRKRGHRIQVCGQADPERDPLLAQALAEAAEAGHLEALGRVSDMRPVYARTRCLLQLSTLEEAFGRTVVEAQLNGLPVVARERGALSEVVGAGGVLLPEDAPPEALPDAVDEALTLSPALCRQNARRFDPRLQLARLEGLLRGLIT